MELRLKLIVLVALLVCVAPLSALALTAPHDSTNGYICTTCHASHNTLGTTGFNNICTSCHNPNDPKAGGKPFYQTDAANPYGAIQNGYSNGVTPSKIYQTSHNWTGKDVRPQAGAQAPTDPRMSNHNISGFLLCARCHNVHGDYSSAGVSKPFLRVRNDNDQMCRDCHKVRDTSNQMMGSHPINKSYTSASSKVKLKSSEYSQTPINTNPSNPTSAMKLVNGKVQCTTCHGVHYTDSRSGTVDGRGSYNNLSASTGHLLRTEARGKTADSINICTNCHISKTAHNGRDQNVQCDDCHTGHVEYDEQAVTAEEKTPNVYLIRRYMKYSSALGKNRRVFYRYTGSSRKEAYSTSGSGVGICQACHKAPATHNESNGDLKSDRTSCQNCHKHVDPNASNSGSFGGGCSSCHGYPPQNTKAGGPNGYAIYSTGKSYNNFGSIYKNESTAGHPTHAAGKPYSYGCSECHNGNSHKTQTYQDVFKTTAGIIAGTGAVYTPGSTTSTCATTYCHSYGDASATNPKTVTWQNDIRGTITKSGTRCVSCHNGVNPVSGFNNMSTGAHWKHVNRNGFGNRIGCASCHSGTVSNNTTIANYAKHANGSRDVDTGSSVGWNVSAKTCTNTCHLSATPNWTSKSTGACGTCHYALAPMIATNGHFTHISTATANAWGPDLAGTDTTMCNKCHTYDGETGTNHINGTVEAPDASCTTACHRNGKPTWTSNARLACSTCHDDLVSYDVRFNNISAPRKAMTTFNAKGHGHYNSQTCLNCHIDTTKHIDGKRGSSNRLGAYEADQNGLCNQCHRAGGTVTDPARQDLNTHILVKDSNLAQGNCSACHDVHGTSNYFSIVNSIKYNSISAAKTIAFATGADEAAAKATVSNFVKLTGDGLCQICHTKTKYFMRYNKDRGYTGQAAWVPSADQHPGGGTTGESCLNCHKHNDTFAFKANGACNSCHGYPPQQGDGKSVAGSSNTHLSHNMASKNISDGLSGSSTGLACSSCHTNKNHKTKGAAAVYTSISTTTYKFNSGAQDYNRTTFTCSNVSCHFKASPAWK